ncbi:LacI family DNA-binding transcriptional regulator [Nonomuraea sp. M3C6]|uniref:LacI family DNA-binding transcriptional regulator n=1 Tax=Nonomuraea marmarensis TaxID=3351344 RepID=A0ABW7A5M6_9ACTN
MSVDIQGQGMASTRVTMGDVARASGVSPATVSFVLNNAPNQTISAETKERVRRAARELGYVPHGIARALREGTSRIVLLDVAAIGDGTNLQDFIRGLEGELADTDHVLLVRPSRIDPVQPLLEAVRPCAIVRLGEIYADGREPADGGWVDGLAAHTAVQIRHLAERGHRHIALAFPDDDDRRLIELHHRYATEAAGMLGMSPPYTLIVPAARGKAVAAVEAFLSAHPDITAIASLGDLPALRVLAAAHDLGLPVPERLAVIGLGDSPYAEMSVPPLTSVRIDAETFGRRAARQALGMDIGGLTPAPARVVARGSG